MSVTKQAKGRFKVGDWVSFQYGIRTIVAQVTEDRGLIGAKKRRFYGIRMVDEFGQEDSFELPEEELERTTVPDRATMVNFLKAGGLIGILRTNLGGPSPQPRVWLTLPRDGDVIHTFHGTPDLVGGATVPFRALHEGRKVFGPKPRTWSGPWARLREIDGPAAESSAPPSFC